MQKAVFGGGCFWCTEAVFKSLEGVSVVKPGYAGGTISHPTYLQVSTGKTGHAEVIYIEYNPDQISYRDLLTVFFASHDSMTLNRQGNDIGTQYRSAIFYATEEQKLEAEQYIKEIEGSVTELKPLDKFYEAENYHHDYYTNHKSAPYCEIIINPKLEKIQKKFVKLLKNRG